MKAKLSSMLNRARQDERGQILIIFILVSAILFLVGVIAVDLGTYVWERQKLENAVDAAALAGGLELPDSGSNAVTVALQYMSINDPGVNPADVSTTFRCLVGDRDNNGSPDSSDVPAVCNPGAGATWACSDKLCISQCAFVGSNSCNVLVVDASKQVSLNFTRILGLPPILLTASQNGACRGFCGTAPTVPVDAIIVIDRSSSMSASELQDAKDGALAVLQIFDPDYQHVGLAVLGAGRPGDACHDQSPSSGGNWLVVGLSADYQNVDGSLNNSSALVSTINCLANSSQGTNLGSPLSDSTFSRPDALSELLNNGRPGVTKGIILLTDGAATDPTLSPNNPCKYANDRATVVKSNDIEIYTIGYGIQSENCNDASGAYHSAQVTALLADMATDSADDHGHCSNATNIAAENADGDHFLCQAKGSDLQGVFLTAAGDLAPGVRLIGSP